MAYCLSMYNIWIIIYFATIKKKSMFHVVRMPVVWIKSRFSTFTMLTFVMWRVSVTLLHLGGSSSRSYRLFLPIVLWIQTYYSLCIVFHPLYRVYLDPEIDSSLLATKEHCDFSPLYFSIIHSIFHSCPFDLVAIQFREICGLDLTAVQIAYCYCLLEFVGIEDNIRHLLCFTLVFDGFTQMFPDVMRAAFKTCGDLSLSSQDWSAVACQSQPL